jgi:L-ascorbate oxidase
VDEHKLKVIASDGAYFDAYEVDSLISYAGERFDFIIETNQSVGNYFIRTKGLADCKPFGAYQTAILNYKNDGYLEKDSLPDNVTFTYDNMDRFGVVS